VGKIYGVMVAAGKGQRMTANTAKQYLLLQAKPIILHSLLIFDYCELIDDIICVVPADDLPYVYNDVLKRHNFKKKITLIAGGYNRQESVYNGLKAISGQADIVAIHDGVRPLLTKEILEVGVTASLMYGAAVVGMPVKETVKEVDEENFILSTPNREDLWIAHTPQVFKYDLIMNAHRKALEENFIGTDDSSLVERMGVRVIMVKGCYRNIKITTSEDLFIADALMSLMEGTH